MKHLGSCFLCIYPSVYIYTNGSGGLLRINSHPIKYQG